MPSGVPLESDRYQRLLERPGVFGDVLPVLGVLRGGVIDQLRLAVRHMSEVFRFLQTLTAFVGMRGIRALALPLLVRGVSQ